MLCFQKTSSATALHRQLLLSTSDQEPDSTFTEKTTMTAKVRRTPSYDLAGHPSSSKVRTLCTEPLGKRQPDLFLAPSRTTKRDGKNNWEDVRIMGELK